MTQYLALKILRDGHPTETALQAILNDYTILPIAAEEVQFGIKAIRDDRTAKADTYSLTLAQQHRAFHVLDLLEGFGDGIEYARLAAGINFIRYGTADEDHTDLIKLFASYYYGAEEAGAWEGEEGDHESEAQLDIRRIMADCAVLEGTAISKQSGGQIAELFAENAKNAPQGENWVAGFRAHQANIRTRAKNAQVDADQLGGLSTITLMNLLAETLEVLEPFYEANYGDDGLSTLTAADLKKAHDHSIKVATLLPDHIPDVGKMVEAQPQLHCMVDLETLGIKPGSVIRSIGAVIFDPHGTGIIAQYYRNISLESAEAYGLTIDDATLTWWENQSAEARATLQTDQRHLVVALSEFEDFWKSQNATHFWSHGANFDEVLLKAAFDAVPAAVPWQYYNVMCSRTLFTLAGNKPDRAKGTHHNALDDATNQALAVQEAYRRLRIPRPAPAPLLTPAQQAD